MENILSEQHSIFLGKHSFPVLADFIPSAVKVAEDIAGLLQFNTTESNKLQMAVEEAVKNVIDHYSTTIDPTDFFDLIFTIEDQALVVSVFEKGIPFKKINTNTYSLANPEQSGLGMHMLNSLMDKVELFVHGRKGKETRLIKYIDRTNIPLGISALYENKQLRQQRKTVKNYTVRRATSDDIANIIRLAWKCYGYTQAALLYNADSMNQMFVENEMVSYIAVNEEDDVVVCHIALKYHEPKVPEMGLAFVDPTYRCPGVMMHVAGELKKYSIDRGDDGIFDRAATTHTFSQKELQEIGAKPCSLLMGVAPAGMQAKMTGTSVQEKGTTINHYNVFNRTEATVYAPEKHREMIAKIYDWMELPRKFAQASTEPPTGKSEVIFEPQPEEVNAAYILVESIGATTEMEIAHYMNDCIQQKMDACYLLMSMQDPYSPMVIEQCEKAGFSFAGIMPHVHNGQDRILMQKLNVKLDFDKIRIYSENSRILFQYVLDELNSLQKK